MTVAKLVAALLFIFSNYYAYNYFASDDLIPEREHFVDFPMQIDDWSCAEQGELPEDVKANLGVTDHLICDYVNQKSGEKINLYVGYHEKQERSDSGKTTLIHPPEHCLPGSGWNIIESEIVDLDSDSVPSQAKRVVIAKGNYRQVVFFWYQSRGRKIATGFDRIFYMFLDRALQSRTDGSLVRLTVLINRDDMDAADATVLSFFEEMTPQLGPFIPN